jgi:hypothetical protein
MPEKCKNDEIRRGYTVKRTGKKVNPTCIKAKYQSMYDTKAKVFTTPIINTMLRKELMATGLNGNINGVLREYGYHTNMSMVERRAILDRIWLALNKNWLSLFQMLNYQAVMNKNNKQLNMLLLSDRDYVKMKYSGQFGGMRM